MEVQVFRILVFAEVGQFSAGAVLLGDLSGELAHDFNDPGDKDLAAEDPVAVDVVA